jgi:hypothetical protein
MLFVNNDNMIEALATNRSDESLAVRVLPWRPNCGPDLFDPERSHLLRECTKEDRVIVSDKETWKCIKREGFDDALLFGEEHLRRLLGEIVLTG